VGEGGAASRSTCFFPEDAALDDADVPKGFCAWTFATNLGRARGITVDAEGNALVVAAQSGQIVALWDDDGDGVSRGDERATLATAQALNHGILLHDGYLYASSPSSVLRWSYAADRAPLGAGTPVVTGIPSGGHSTRTLAFDDRYLYVSVGSGSNVDGNSERSRIRRFPVPDLESGLLFNDGEVFADGLRNEVGLRFDSRGRLWGVENGRDDLSRADLGGDIHEDNPAEELNLFETPGRFYGYPYCWSEFLLGDEYAGGDGTQWADPSFIDDGTHDDEWCQNADNVVPPVIAMQAHAAPLDLLFYPGGSFPASYTNDLFVTFHGSWNRDQPTGYKVMHIPFGDDGMPAGVPAPILESSGPDDDDWPHRPVGLAVLPNGTLLITSDESDRVLALGYAE
jgi:glucose/arabinose dehydrogenase